MDTSTTAVLLLLVLLVLADEPVTAPARQKQAKKTEKTYRDYLASCGSYAGRSAAAGIVAGPKGALVAAGIGCIAGVVVEVSE